jgi:hypothetical protein
MPGNNCTADVNTGAAHLTGGLPRASNDQALPLRYCAVQVPLQGNPALHAGLYCTLCDRATQGLLVCISCSHPMSWCAELATHNV